MCVERVARQRAADLRDPLLVSDRPASLGDLDLKIVPRALGEAAQLAAQRPRHLAQIDRRALDRQPAGVDAREVEQVGGELGSRST